jgi:hypothetical protein
MQDLMWSSKIAKKFKKWQIFAQSGHTCVYCDDLASVLPDGIFSYQKIPIWVYFGGPWNGKCWHILWPFVLFDDRSVYLMVFCNI